MSIKQVKCDYGISPIEYTIENYIADNGKEMFRVVILSGKAYVLYMVNPDTLDGKYDVLYAGDVWENERRLLIDVTPDGLCAKEFLAALDEGIEYNGYKWE